MGSSQNQNNISDDFLTLYPSIDFEPLPRARLTTVYVLYRYDIQRKKESFAIYIPMPRWRVASARPALIQEVVRKIAEIFPSRGGQNLRSFHPSHCRGNQIANFPVTQDWNAIDIQDTRASIQLGCMSFDSHETSIETLAPALPKEGEPKDAGNYYFTCDFHYGAASASYELTARAGQHSLNSKMWGVGTGTIDGMASVSGDGQIEFTFISISPEKGV